MYKIILHITDLAENHFDMCEKAVQFASEINARLYIMHVIESPPSLQIAQGLGFTEIYNPNATEQNAKEILNIIGESLNIKKDRQIVEIGSIKQHVLNKITELSCDLIIVGKHAQNIMPGFLTNSAHNVVNESSCDILTICS
jgi:nucleotide-binding universal stress UspA family protein